MDKTVININSLNDNNKKMDVLGKKVNQNKHLRKHFDNCAYANQYKFVYN